MSINFSSDEIFEIAEQIERNGAVFYRKAAEMFSEEAVRGIILNLAVMEECHEKIFASMRTELKAGDIARMTFDPDNQAVLYLQAAADGKVFDLESDPADKLPEKASLNDVLDYAIGIEKESVVFYTGMKEVVPENLGKSKIDGIIKEEIGHIIELRAQKDSLKQ